MVSSVCKDQLNEVRPKVSVMTSIYNTNPKHLRECIESILNQTFKDFEFIILSDSPDDTALDEIVKSYSDPRIKFFKNAKNEGISVTRNRMLELANGEYWAVFDHDDISLPERLQKEVEYLDANPSVGVIGTFVQYFNDTQKDGGHVVKCPPSDYEIRCALTESCYLAHTSVMFRSECLTKHGIKYDPFFTTSEDYQIFNELLDVTRFHVIQEVLVKYRIHDNRTSNLKNDDMRQKATAVKLSLRNRYPAYREQFLKNNPRTQYYVKLFGVIPLYKYKNNYIWLFNCIPVLKVVWK